MDATLKVRRSRRALTLIEILVTMVVASIVLIGALQVYADAAGDFAMWSRLREKRFSQSLVDSEVGWVLRRVPPDVDKAGRPGLRQTQAAWDDALVTSTGPDGTIARKVLTYEFTKTVGDLNPGAAEEWTGIVFQYGSVAYRYEATVAVAGGSFVTRTRAALQTFCDTRRNDCDILAIGVATLNFAPDFTNPVLGVRGTWDTVMY